MDPLAHKWHPPPYPLSHITKGERKKGNIQSILKKSKEITRVQRKPSLSQQGHATGILQS